MMPQTRIFGPVFATVFVTLLVWIYMYVRRIGFLTRNKIDPRDMAVPGALAQISPPEVVNPSDNLKNLFEIPVIFYALALYLFVTSQVDAAYVTAAWIFVTFRALHSAVHCTINIVTLRFYLYLISTLAVWLPSNPRLQRTALRAAAEPSCR
ncbi:MAG: MAPEG family protein [Gammaproteobacteria bacterium]